MTRVPTGVLLVTSLAAVSLFAGSARGALRDGAAPAWAEVETLSGARSRVDLSLGLPLAMEIGAVVRVQFSGLDPGTPADPADAVRVDLRGGERVLGILAGIPAGADERVDLLLLGGGRLGLGLDRIQRIVFPGRLASPFLGPLEAPARGDRLYRLQRSRGSGMDRLDGALEGLSPAGILFESVLGRGLVPWDEVAAVYLEDLDGGSASALASGGGKAPVAVDLVGGGRLVGSLERLDGAGLALRRRGERVDLPLGTLRQVTLIHPALAFLSDLTPSGVEEEPPFGPGPGMSWPHRMDGAVIPRGAPLRAGGQTWPRGIGVHAPSRLTWALDGRWSHLRGQVAMDAGARHLPVTGRMAFRVLGDGKLLWESGPMGPRDAPRPMGSIALSGVSKLVLEVDALGDFRGDRGNWLAPLLVRMAADGG